MTLPLSRRGIGVGLAAGIPLLLGALVEMARRSLVRTPGNGPELLGDYANDEHFRAGLQRWLNDLWLEKNRRIEEMLTS